MGKATDLGLVPPDDPMFSSGPEVFSRLGSNGSSTNSASDTTGAPPTSSEAQPDPMQPVAEACEKVLMELIAVTHKNTPSK